MADAGEQIIGLIPVAIGAKIITSVLDDGPRRKRKKNNDWRF